MEECCGLRLIFSPDNDSVPYDDESSVLYYSIEIIGSCTVVLVCTDHKVPSNLRS